MRKRDKALEDSIEKTNNHKIDILHSQVIEIKHSAQSIHEETKSSLSYLESLSEKFDKGKKSVNSVYDRFETLLQERSNRLSIYICGVLTIFFLIIWKYMLG
jgi:vacuolar-type H+-ATPase subunit H